MSRFLLPLMLLAMAGASPEGVQLGPPPRRRQPEPKRPGEVPPLTGPSVQKSPRMTIDGVELVPGDRYIERWPVVPGQVNGIYEVRHGSFDSIAPNTMCACGHPRHCHDGHTHPAGTPAPTHCSQRCGCTEFRALNTVRRAPRPFMEGIAPTRVLVKGQPEVECKLGRRHKAKKNDRYCACGKLIPGVR